jgi:hypothetical protein
MTMYEKRPTRWRDVARQRDDVFLAIHDAVREGVIDRPMRVFAPGFGAGAVGGYVIMRVDPSIVA